TGKSSAVIAAAELLRNHQGDKAVSLLLELGKQSEAAAAAPAGARLLALGEKLAWPLYPQLRNHPDPVLRAQAVELLYRMPQGENLTQLADFLADEHPDVRQKARKSLLELATKRGLKKEILIQGERLLATDGWRAQEQAGILLTDLDHKPITPRLLALLSSKRPEVFVMASWGLRKLAVKDTLPPILKIVEKEVITLRAGRRPGDVLDDVLLLTDYKLAHLIQFLGMERYEPALPILRKLIPQQGMTEIRISETRAAGIWALGMIYDGKLQKDLVPQLEGRIRAISSFPPEDPRVCGMAAITLGRMSASEALPTLKQYYTAGQYSQDIINNSCGWAVTKITGGPAPRVTPFRRQDLSLFLNALE
ncbi:MAG: HEAT repeat domain-containing protein, partial [Gemmataceae bacterium]